MKVQVYNPIADLEKQSGLNPHEREQLKQVSQHFEALFLNQMVSAMRQTVERGGLIPESQGEKVYRSMLDTEHSQKMAESEQIGLSHMIYAQLLRGAAGQ